MREAYEAEIRRLERVLEGASDEDAAQIQEAIGELEAELVVEAWPMED